MLQTAQLPHNLEAEEAVIGSLLIDGAAFEKVRYFLKPEHFYSAQNQYLYQACFNLKERLQAIDQVTVAEELNRQGKLDSCGGAANLSRLISICPTSFDIVDYAQIVQRLAVMREIIRAGERISEIGYSGLSDGNEAIEKAAQVIKDCQRENIHVSEIISPEQVGTEILELIGKYNGNQIRMTYGFNVLDKTTTGMYGGELIIIGARPSIGKTQLMLDASENIALARPEAVQLFVSAEMSMRMIEERKIARALRVPVRDLRTKGLSESLDGELAGYAGRVAEQNIYYLPHGTSSADIIQCTRKLRETVGLAIVWIDYLGKLKDARPLHRNENQNQAIGRVCGDLKQLALDLDIPVVAACQLNRGIEHREEKLPKLADLRDSGNIEQDADTVLLLHRDMVNDPQTLNVKLAKHRQVGEQDPVDLYWDYKAQRYSEVKNG